MVAVAVVVVVVVPAVAAAVADEKRRELKALGHHYCSVSLSTCCEYCQNDIVLVRESCSQRIQMSKWRSVQPTKPS